MAAGDVTQGRRLPDGFHYKDSEPGDYWRQSFGETPQIPQGAARGHGWQWTINDPSGSQGTLGDHDVVEHEDGTITVHPSILNASDGGWHGYLERGVWREV